jgi:hypothetical protein
VTGGTPAGVERAARALVGDLRAIPALSAAA